MISTMVRTLSRVPISLRSLAVCVACEECFELGDPTCPTCGSDEYVPLLHQLEGRILNMTSNNWMLVRRAGSRPLAGRADASTALTSGRPGATANQPATRFTV